MANTFDLEEQEQIAQLKAFWNQYGNGITWLLILVFGGIAAWNGWQYWQAKQAAAASVLYDEIERAAKGGDAARVELAFTDIKDKYGRTVFAQQGALLAAKGLYSAGQVDKAATALEWAAGQSADPALAAVARLRLSALSLERNQPDAAEKWLETGIPEEFAGLAADRRGDILMSKGMKNEARQAYQQAYSKTDERAEYRRLIEIKLNALGVEVGESAATGK